MAVVASSITNKSIQIKSPSGTYYDVNSVVYTAANGNLTVKFARTFTNSENGTWGIYSSTTDKIVDSAGNAVVGGTKLGEFVVNIPVPAGDTTAPTLVFVSVSPASITTAGNTEVTVTLTLTDT